ncbi:MAG: histidine kinase [Cyclobacteriaceae bacterium]
MNLLVSDRKTILWTGLILLLLFLSFLVYRFEPDQTIYFTILWIIAVSMLLLGGNSLIARFLNKHFSWLKFGTYRFVLHLFLGIIYSLLVINGAYLLFKYLLTAEAPVIAQIVVTNVYGVAIFIPLFSIYFSLYFLRHWRESLIITENAQKEQIKAELVSLKDHLDPHFLFNNLNILSSLIEIDTDRSQEFLSEFAEVYRAILLSKDEDLITLDRELKFIDSYIYLIKTRFRDDINFELSIDNRYRQALLPPLSIQMLIENAVKHNKITETKPLTITIATQDDSYLLVKNNLNPKEADESVRSGSGINNLKGRYAPFTTSEIEVGASDDVFEIRLPLIDTETT